MKRLAFLLVLFLLVGAACAPVPAPDSGTDARTTLSTLTPIPESTPPPPPSPTVAPTTPSTSSPTMAACREWIRQTSTLDYTNHDCADYADTLRNVERMGGGVIPVGDNRFFIVWFPNGWEQSPERKIIFTIHGNGGCAEVNFDWWSEVAEAHDYAVVSLQYAEEDVNDVDPREEHLFDDARVVYANLTAAYDELQAHCPVADAPALLHGFSRGSAMSYNLALMDRGPDGQHLFAAYIADSGGTGPAGTGDTPPEYLQDAPADAYGGAHFWLYCGMQDKDGVRCQDVEKAGELIQEHGAVVDELYVNQTGGHGIFIREGGALTPAIEAMLNYIDSRVYLESVKDIVAPTPVPEGGPSPTLATCRAWIRESHSLDYPDHGCDEHSEILNSIAAEGGGVIPLQDSKFFIVRFPDDWEQQSERTLIVTLHGSGACSERLYRWWSHPAEEHGYALVALQYARADASSEEGYAFDDAEQIYANLRTVFAELEAHCPLDDTVVVYHGFSRGSARSFKVALLDRADDGMGLFTAFISDSGTEFADTGGEIPEYLQEAGPDDYAGARFWLYCGGEDHDGMTCEGVRRMAPLLEEHGATVDTYRYAPGGHGIFSTVKPGGPPSEAVLAMYDYIAGLPRE